MTVTAPAWLVALAVLVLGVPTGLAITAAAIFAFEFAASLRRRR